MTSITRASSHLLVFVVLTLCLAFSTDTAARQIAGELVREAPAQSQSTQSKQALAKAMPSLARAERMRAVGIDRDVLRLAGREAAAKRDTALQVGFFDDAKLTLEITGSERTHSGGVALVGRVAGAPHSSVVVVDNNGVVSVQVASGDLKYSIQGSPAQGYVAAQLPAHEELPGAHNDMHPPPSGAARHAVPQSASGAKSIAKDSFDDGSLIDVMVVYTPAARLATGGTAQIEASIDAQIALTNLAYQNSNVVQRVRLVHKAEFAYVEGDAFQDLGRFSANKTATGEQLTILRDTHAADLVSVWGVWPQVCGIAWLLSPEWIGYSEYAFSIVNAPACTGPGATSFAHELGHNMGMLHDYLMHPRMTRVTPEGSTTAVDINYAHGYIDPVNRFVTIMAYNSACVIAGLECTFIPYFSNPALTFDNSAYYPGAVPAPLGDAQSNVRQALNDTRETIANYRVSLNGPVLNVLAFADRRIRVSEGAGSVAVRVMRSSGSAGAVSVNYATANGTAVAGTDYTATSGTLNWADGDTTDRTINVPVLQDALLSGSVAFDIALSGATAGAYAGTPFGTGGLLTVTIFDDEPDPYPPGGVMPAGFNSPSATPWVVDNTNGNRSSVSLASGRVLNGTSDLEYTGNFGAGNLTFAFLLDSPEGTSQLEFMIDNVVVFSQAGGVHGWTSVSRPIGAGTHTLRWRYTNTGTEPCFCENRAWIDDFTRPAATPTNSASYLAFIPNSSSNSVSVINLADNTVIATIPVGANPMGVAAHPDGTRVYVTNTGSGTVSVIDAVKHTVIQTLAVGGSLYGIAINPAGTRAYVAKYNANQVGVIDTVTDTVLPGIAGGQGGYGIAINSTGTRAYIGILNGSTAETIDLVNNVSLGRVSNGWGGFGAAVQPDDSKVWVVNNQARRVAWMSTATGTFTSWATVGGQPIGVAAHPTNDRIYVSTGAPFPGQPGGNTIAVVNAVTGVVEMDIPVGGAPLGISIHPAGTHAYAVNQYTDNVSVINLGTNTVVATVAVGDNPQGLGKFIAAVTRSGAPASVGAVAGVGKVTLSFLPPIFDGGNPVIQYDATCNPGNVTVSGAASPLVMNGLANGTTYSCTVKAWTANGAGAESAVVTATPSTSTVIVSANAASFPVLSPGTFTVQAQGAPVTSFTYTGTLPAGVQLRSGGLLSGTPASGTAGSYPITITANSAEPQPGTQNFTLTVTRIAQAIDFAALPAKSEADPAFTVSATGGASGNPVVFSSTTPAVCTTSGTNGATVTLVMGGSCSLAANQAGNADYDAAETVTRTFAVRVTQTLSVTLPPTLEAGVTHTLSAVSGASGNPVIFASITPATCTTSGTNGMLLEGYVVGTCTITVNQAGNASYDPAPQLTLSLEIVRGQQTIQASTLSLPIGVPTQRITSSGDSGLPVALVSQTPSICTTDGTLITAIEFGLCTITANQPGNANFFPAPEVTFSMLTFSPMSKARASHAAALLPDGRVLVAGGQHYPSGMQATADLFDPATKRWTAAPNMAASRWTPAATLLQDGRVLVTGGLNAANQLVAAAEIFDPATNTWSAAGSMSMGRYYHTATRLGDGRVLVAGGTDNGTLSVEIYTPATNTWSAAANMTIARRSHTAVLLPNGKVFVAGGRSGSTTQNTTEIYDPVANTWTAAASMSATRFMHSAVGLADGTVIVAGGSTNTLSERYDPVANTWSGAGVLSVGPGHTASLLQDGQVLVAGGTGTTRNTAIYNPGTNSWTASAQLLFQHVGHTATVLNDGGVLIAGGSISSFLDIHNNAEVRRFTMSVLDVTLPPGRIGLSYGPVSFTASGAAAPVTFTQPLGSLPPGMTLSAAGVLGGVPSTVGSYEFTVTATDANGQSASRAFTILVTEAPFTVTPSLSGGNGTITPIVPQAVAPSGSAVFTLTPAYGYGANMSGTCGGTLTGNTYTTAPVTANCTVIASFAQIWFKPDAPVIGAPVPGPASAMVHFTPPANDGGTPITNYTAECISSNNDYKYGSSATSPVTVNNMLTGRSQRCTVTATNAIGTSVASAQTAAFQVLLPNSALNVALTGAGAATSSVTGNGIDCGSDCTELLQPTVTVSLTANPGPGVLFSGWGGSGIYCDSKRNDAPTCQFPQGAGTRNVSAIFLTTAEVPAAPLAVGAIAKVEAIEVDYYGGPGGGSPITQFNATCTPTSGGPGITVSGLQRPILVTGLTPGIAYVCSLSATSAIGTGAAMSAAANIPLFGNHTLAVTKAGVGAGTVVSNTGGLVCGATCSVSYAGSTTVTLSAQPSAGSTFTGWTGGTGGAAGCTGTGTCVISMAADATVVATFNPPNFTVTPSAGAGGTISPSTPQSVAFNTAATFTVTPGVGYTASVGGTCGGTLTGTTYTTAAVVADCTVAASFALSSARRFDATGNGTSDVIWYHTGVFGVIGMNANGLALDPYYIIDVQSDANWKIVGLGDLNADGRADLVWHNATTGELYGLLLNGGTVLSEGRIALEANLDWKPEQIADVNGDGKTDIVWKNQATGDVFIMLMNGLAQTGGQVVYTEPNLNWKIVGSGDMNGDGRADLLWRNVATGDVFAMLMDGFTVLSGGVIYTEPNLNWKIVGLADYNGDGKSDVLWQNVATGDVFQMQMNGTVSTAGAVIYNEPNTQWKIVALGDYNGDGKADLLWQNTATGHVYMMLMDGFTMTSANFVYTEPDTQWQIVGP